MAGTELEAPKLLDADELIDEILARKGPQKYKDGLSEENWEQELEQIPLFMTESPKDFDPVKAPSLAALQTLKYETETPQGRATSHKEEGNELFRHKKYKDAVAEYTAGIKEKAEDRLLNAILHTNRAAAQFHLGNYRSSLTDASRARAIKPDHMKALVRGVLACVQLSRYGEAIEWCDEGLKLEPENGKLRELRTEATKNKKQQERDERKRLSQEKEKRRQTETLLKVIESRGVCLNDKDTDSLVGPHPSGGRVHLDSEGHLVWPVLFLYPEFGQTDYIEAFNERDRFTDHLQVMFGGESPPWDKEHLYTPSDIKVFYEHSSTKRLVEVKVQSSLAEVLRMEGYVVQCRTPSFILLSSKSPFYHQHISSRT